MAFTVACTNFCETALWTRRTILTCQIDPFPHSNATNLALPLAGRFGKTTLSFLAITKACASRLDYQNQPSFRQLVRNRHQTQFWPNTSQFGRYPMPAWLMRLLG